ncbi:hypothetical protein ENSA5_63410 [Enhygromyxa salina]|uniref:Uncharacterized protein n=2 Tax=Enhygromyxa salina TaxID=215803 RepID=A0A2S9XCF8_9BACT|nr:hypothetical protein ENSA5_63410 [Enhygromyxa salina]
MADDGELGAAVVRAVRVELNDVDVALESVAMVGAEELRGRIDAAEELIRERGALGLVWLEPRADGLVIHLVVADAGMLRRPVVGVDEPGAAVEAAAVIVRHFTTDLLAGRPIGLTRFPDRAEEGAEADAGEREDRGAGERRDGSAPVEAPPIDEAAPRRPNPLERRGGSLRLQAGYVGQAWARERAWDSGAELALGWRSALGVHVGAGFALIPRFEATVVHPTVSGLMTYRVGRYPLSVFAGYQHLWARPGLALDFQLRVVAEFHERSATDPIGDVRIELSESNLRVIPALEPRLQIDYLPLPQLSVFAAVGLRAALVDVEYAVGYEVEGEPGGGAQTRVLRPNLVSPIVLLGVAVFL